MVYIPTPEAIGQPRGGRGRGRAAKFTLDGEQARWIEATLKEPPKGAPPGVFTLPIDVTLKLFNSTEPLKKDKNGIDRFPRNQFRRALVIAGLTNVDISTEAKNTVAVFAAKENPLAGGSERPPSRRGSRKADK